jgi:hypothetical protein
LFVLAIDPLQQLIDQATHRKLLSKLGAKAARFRASLYADDAAIFIKPTRKDITNLPPKLWGSHRPSYKSSEDSTCSYQVPEC